MNLFIRINTPEYRPRLQEELEQQLEIEPDKAGSGRLPHLAPGFGTLIRRYKFEMTPDAVNTTTPGRLTPW